MRYSRDISLLYLRFLVLTAVHIALRITTLQKAWNVYSICSLYSSVQVMEIPPFLKGLCVIDGLLYNYRGRQHSLLLPLDYPLAKAGGAVNGGAVRAVHLDR